MVNQSGDTALAVGQARQHIALSKQHDPHLEALILQAAADIQRLNPHLGAPERPLTEAEYTELERERQEAQQVWDAMDRQRGGPLGGEPAAEAVDADRGE